MRIPTATTHASDELSLHLSTLARVVVENGTRVAGGMLVEALILLLVREVHRRDRAMALHGGAEGRGTSEVSEGKRREKRALRQSPT